MNHQPHNTKKFMGVKKEVKVTKQQSKTEHIDEHIAKIRKNPLRKGARVRR